MLTSPFPSSVSFCALSADTEVPTPIHLEEANACAQACDRRLQEFLLGRAAAHRAIVALCGRSDQPIGRGPRGEPLWPPGLLGTITHTRGVAIAAVARCGDSGGLGLDVERLDRHVTPEVAHLVANAAEQAWIAAVEESRGIRLKLLFSAKEAVFKALYPIGQVFLGYKDAELCWDSTRGCFTAQLLVDAAPTWPSGSKLTVGSRLDGEYLMTWVCLPP